jgi:MtrB/PioB family decaheme-associated outer membrane protein
MRTRPNVERVTVRRANGHALRRTAECGLAEAVRSAMLALLVLPATALAEIDPADPAVRALTHETSHVEVGAGVVTSNSAKFGEYNGLGNRGPFGTGGFQLNGGGEFDSNDATRWRLRGDNLGLENRELDFEYGEQGKYRFRLGYSELLHRLSDSYQTPYRGVSGGSLTLPSTWLKPVVPQVSATAINFRALSPVAGTGNCVVTAGVCPTGTPSAAQLNQLSAIRNADLPLFQNVDLKIKRKDYDAGVTLQLNSRWDVVADYQHNLRQGIKPLGAVSTLSTFESTVILPEPIDTTTDQVNLRLQYTGDQSFMQAAYYGSMFRNSIRSVSWQDPSNLAVTSTQSSAPSNQFHQGNLTGGFNMSPSTKLVMHAALGRNTQNDSFLSDSSLPIGIPTASLNGVVVTKGFDATLTSRPRPGLNVVAAYKFADRDNQTPVNRFAFYDISQPATGASSFNGALGLPAGTLGSNINIFNNRPLSVKTNQLRLDADYAVTKQHTAAAGVEYRTTDRHCNGDWYNCADAQTAKEGTLRTEWRARWTDEINSKLAYAYSRRHVDYDVNSWLALAPMANVVPGAPTVGATTSAYGFMQQTGLSGWGPIAGFPATPLTGQAAIFTPNNSIITQALYGSRDQLAENPRLRRFDMANRDRNKLRTAASWEPTERLSLQGGLDFINDQYPDSSLGTQNSRGWTLNLDGAYNVADGFSVNAFYTYEWLRNGQTGFNYVANAAAGVPAPIIGGCFANTALKNLNNKVDPCNAWSSQSRDSVHTLGLSARKRDFLGRKLDLSGDLVLSFADTNIDVQGGNYATNVAGTGLIFIPATDLPAVKSNSISARLSALYALDRSSAVRFSILHKRLRSSDFAYAGTQFGTMTTFMPSNEQAPNYNVTVVGVSFVHNFQ